MSTPPPKRETWLTVTPVSFGIAFDDKIMEQNWEFPTGRGPNGQVKFLARDKGTQLGYRLSFAVAPKPVAQMPEAYRHVKKLSNRWTEGPPEQLELIGKFKFSLYDADGFLLSMVLGPTEYISAGSKNAVQNTVEDPIPPSIRG